MPKRHTHVEWLKFLRQIAPCANMTCDTYPR